MQGLSGSLGQTHGALVPSTKYVLSKCEALSLLPGVGTLLGADSGEWSALAGRQV